MIETLALEHFMSYRDRQILPMSNRGLVLIQGRNLISSALDTNGVGKSAIADAVSWCLFDKVLPRRKPIRGDDMANRFTAQPCVVTVALSDDLGSWAVMRSRRPAGLETEGVPPTQDAIEARLGFGYRTFCHAVVFGQNALERFAQASQADQIQMLDEIRGFDCTRWLEGAKRWREDVQRQWQDGQTKMQAQEASLVVLRGQCEELRRIRDQFVQTIAAQITKSTADLDTLASRRAAMLVQQDRQEQRLKELLVRENALKRVAEIDAQKNLASACVQTAQATCRERQRQLDEAWETIEQMAREGKCPTCRAPVASIKAIQPRFKADLAGLTRLVDAANEVMQKALNDLEDANVRYAAAATDGLTGDEGPQIVREVQQLQGLLRAGSEALGKVNAQIAAITASIEQARQARWDGASILASTEKAERQCVQEIDRLQWTMARLDRTKLVAEYWVEAFGDRGIRSLMLDEDVNFLTARVAAHLDVLAGGEATVNISPLKTLKGGGLRERLTIDAAWSWGGDVFGSVGQDRRIDLAIFAAMQDLAEVRSARPMPFKFWDEPGDSLDPRGRELFLGWVRQQARDRGTGFLVTHSADMAAMADPDETWTVVLDGQGARVERR